MNELYPLKFQPIFKEKIWGGNRIGKTLGLDTGGIENCGEVWLVSSVEGDVSVVSNGYLKGNNLNELIEVYMSDLTGDKVYETFGEGLPVLLKIIDTNDYLSVQVHPDDEIARRRGLPNGKNEMWYIMEATPGAHIINGFREKINQADFHERLNNRQLSEVLNYMPVSSGDTFYIPAGRIHALGPGIMLAEVQQTSDVTYRVYDWDRKDKNGQYRELHTELAMDAIDFNPSGELSINYSRELNRTVSLHSSPSFSAGLLHFDEPVEKDYDELDSFVLHLCLEGNYRLVMKDDYTVMSPGEAVMLPAITGKVLLIPEADARMLEIYML